MLSCLKDNYARYKMWLFIFFINLFFASSFMPFQKAIIGFALVCEIIYLLFIGGIKIHLHPIVQFWCLLYFIRELFFAIYTAYELNELVLRPIFFEVVFVYIVNYLDSDEKINYLIKIMKFSLFSITLYLLYVIASITIMPFLPSITIDGLFQGSGTYDSMFRFSSWNITSLIMLLPFFITYYSGLLLRKKIFKTKNISFNLYVFLFIALSILCAILSGRRALWLVTTLAFAVAIGRMIYCWLRERIFVKRILLIASVCLVSYGFLEATVFTSFNLMPIIRRISSIGDFSSGGNLKRKYQINKLLEASCDRPLFGYGYNARLNNYPYGDGRNFESSYFKMIFNGGYVGLFSFLTLIIMLIFMSLYIIYYSNKYNNLCFSSLIMLISIIIANATNPYLGQFTTQWSVFFPLIPINRYLIENSIITKKDILSE